MTWPVERFREPPSRSHARAIPDPPSRVVWLFEPTRPALVLGSTQRREVVDTRACEERGIEVVQRRSGGGSVLVEPDALLWVDVVVPAGDPLWDDDVGRASAWLTRCWADALAELGVSANQHEGPMARSPLSDLVCFAGRAPGELVGPGGAKLVGVAQRRTRVAARFQCAALGRWQPADLAPLLRLSSDAVEELSPAAAGVGVPLPALVDAFLRHLP